MHKPEPRASYLGDLRDSAVNPGFGIDAADRSLTVAARFSWMRTSDTLRLRSRIDSSPTIGSAAPRALPIQSRAAADFGQVLLHHGGVAFLEELALEPHRLDQVVVRLQPILQPLAQRTQGREHQSGGKHQDGPEHQGFHAGRIGRAGR